MSVRYLLDTNVVSFFLRRSSPALEARVTDALRNQSCAVSVITRAELRYGQALMQDGDKRRALVDAFLRQVPHLPWSGAAADCFGELKAHNRRRRTIRGDLDTQIAAQAVVERLILVTHNVKDFAGTPDLVVEEWMRDEC